MLGVVSLTFSLQRQSAQVWERVVENLLGAAATASEQLAVITAMASKRLAVTESMLSKCCSCYVSH